MSHVILTGILTSRVKSTKFCIHFRDRAIPVGHTLFLSWTFCLLVVMLQHDLDDTLRRFYWRGLKLKAWKSLKAVWELGPANVSTHGEYSRLGYAPCTISRCRAIVELSNEEIINLPRISPHVIQRSIVVFAQGGKTAHNARDELVRWNRCGLELRRRTSSRWGRRVSFTPWRFDWWCHRGAILLPQTLQAILNREALDPDCSAIWRAANVRSTGGFVNPTWKKDGRRASTNFRHHYT